MTRAVGRPRTRRRLPRNRVGALARPHVTCRRCARWVVKFSDSECPCGAVERVFLCLMRSGARTCGTTRTQLLQPHARDCSEADTDGAER